MTHVLTHRGLPDGMTRWDLYGLLVKAAKHYGLTDTTLKYLRFAISRTPDHDNAAEVILPSHRLSRIWRRARLKGIADALEALIWTLAEAPTL